MECFPDPDEVRLTRENTVFRLCQAIRNSVLSPVRLPIPPIGRGRKSLLWCDYGDRSSLRHSGDRV